MRDDSSEQPPAPPASDAPPRCQSCGVFIEGAVAGQAICESCYAACGSCCAEACTDE